MDRLLTIASVAEILAVSRRTVYRLIKDDSLYAVLVSNRYRIRQSDLQKFIKLLGKEIPESALLERRVEASEFEQLAQR